MERKYKYIWRSLVIASGFGLLLTLLFCNCNSGQVTPKEFWTAERKRIFTKFILIYGQARQRERCLSVDIKTASDTKSCFDCHDKIVRE